MQDEVTSRVSVTSQSHADLPDTLSEETRAEESFLAIKSGQVYRERSLIAQTPELQERNDPICCADKIKVGKAAKA